MSIMHHATPAGNSLAPRGRRPRSLRPAPSPRPAWSPPAPPESPEMEAVEAAVAEFHAATEAVRQFAPADSEGPGWDDAIAQHNEAEATLSAAIRRFRPGPPAGAPLDLNGRPYWQPWASVGSLLFVATADCGLVVLDLGPVAPRL